MQSASWSNNVLERVVKERFVDHAYIHDMLRPHVLMLSILDV